MLRDRDNVIDELAKQIDEIVILPPKPSGPFYRAVRGDVVDELLAKYVNQMRNPVPVKRLGDGNYYFGTKKV